MPDSDRPGMASEPRAFDGYEYRVTRADGQVFEGCHAMPSFSGKSVVLVVPSVDGVGGAIAGDLRDHHVQSVERTGVHNAKWAAREFTVPGSGS